MDGECLTFPLIVRYHQGNQAWNVYLSGRLPPLKQFSLGVHTDNIVSNTHPPSSLFPVFSRGRAVCGKTCKYLLSIS